MGALNEFQKKHCPKQLNSECWETCSKCPNGRITEGQFAGSYANCTLKATVPKVMTVIGRNKKEILEAIPEIEDKMKHGFQRGKVGEVFWNMDEPVPPYFTFDYDSEHKECNTESKTNGI